MSKNQTARRPRLVPWLVGLLAAVTGASLLGPWWWVPALIVHFRPHLAIASLVLLIVSAMARRPVAAALSLAMLASHGAPLWPYLDIAGGAHAAAATNLRVFALNMHGRGTAADALRQAIETEHPDIVVLTEMPDNIDRMAHEIAGLPPYRAGEPPRSPRDSATSRPGAAVSGSSPCMPRGRSAMAPHCRKSSSRSPRRRPRARPIAGASSQAT